MIVCIERKELAERFPIGVIFAVLDVDQVQYFTEANDDYVMDLTEAQWYQLICRVIPDIQRAMKCEEYQNPQLKELQDLRTNAIKRMTTMIPMPPKDTI